MKTRKEPYTGLLTQRKAVECQPLMEASTVKVRFKTEQPTNTEWKDGFDETLESEIMSSTLE